MINFGKGKENMKKIIFTGCIFSLINSVVAAATYDCKVTELTFNAVKLSNEYLFTNDSAHDHTNGMALICGHKKGAVINTPNGCDSGTIVVVGANHVWKNNKVSALNAYSCGTSGGNAWASIGVADFQQCSEEQKETWKRFGEISDYTGKRVVYCKTIVNSGNYGQYCFSKDQDDICVDKGCQDCEKKVESKPKDDTKSEPKLRPKTKPEPKPEQENILKNCAEQYPSDAAAQKCCEWAENGKPVKWVDGVCRCKDQNKTLDTETGECKDMFNCKVIASGRFGPCPDESYVDVKGIEFKLSEHFAIEQVATENGYCKDKDMTKEEMEKVLADARVKEYVIAQLCTKDNSGAGASSSSNEVQQAKQKLESFFGSVASGKRDVWKDADGNFNTKRLASDLTAGVVLGTVGGVVSGVVIKKKQIEKGFEALHCTVGGQTVADWGDTFTVGLNR